VDPQSSDIRFWTVISSACLGVAGAVRWWYHVRRMQNADSTDGAVTKSISFVINELKDEIARAKAEHKELRTRILALEAQNELQRTEIEALRAKAAATCRACGLPV